MTPKRGKKINYVKKKMSFEKSQTYIFYIDIYFFYIDSIILINATEVTLITV